MERQTARKNYPYNPDNAWLNFFPTGLTSKDSDCFNCDNAEDLCQQIQIQMDGNDFTQTKITRSSRLRTLQDLQPNM